MLPARLPWFLAAPRAAVEAARSALRADQPEQPLPLEGLLFFPAPKYADYRKYCEILESRIAPVAQTRPDLDPLGFELL